MRHFGLILTLLLPHLSIVLLSFSGDTGSSAGQDGAVGR